MSHVTTYTVQGGVPHVNYVVRLSWGGIDREEILGLKHFRDYLNSNRGDLQLDISQHLDVPKISFSFLVSQKIFLEIRDGPASKFTTVYSIYTLDLFFTGERKDTEFILKFRNLNYVRST